MFKRFLHLVWSDGPQILFHIGLLNVTSVQVALTGETDPMVENDMPLPVLEIHQQEPISLVVSRLTCT